MSRKSKKRTQQEEGYSKEDDYRSEVFQNPEEGAEQSLQRITEWIPGCFQQGGEPEAVQVEVKHKMRVKTDTLSIE